MVVDVDETFRYTETGKPQATLKRRYLSWRRDRGMLERCDLGDCPNPIPLWKGKKLQLILDHKNGVNSDNRLENLRLVCPNCNSLLKTTSGRNKGRVVKSSGGFSILDRENMLRAYLLPVEGGRYVISSNPSLLVHAEIPPEAEPSV